jgi:hypothetical protein
MDKFASSLEDAMQEDQGASLVCKYKMNLLPKVPRTKVQLQDIPEDQDKRPKFMRQDLYLDRGDNTSKTHMQRSIRSNRQKKRAQGR